MIDDFISNGSIELILIIFINVANISSIFELSKCEIPEIHNYFFKFQ